MATGHFPVSGYGEHGGWGALWALMNLLPEAGGLSCHLSPRRIGIMGWSLSRLRSLTGSLHLNDPATPYPNFPDSSLNPCC